MKVTGAQLPVPSAPASGARAAQRAFFDAALQQTTSVAQTRRAVEPPPRAVQPKTTALRAEPPEPGRLLRPGSLLDIKV